MEILYKVRLEIDGLHQLTNMNWGVQSSNLGMWRFEVCKHLRLAKSWTTKIIKILNPEENSSDILLPKEFDPNILTSSVEFMFSNQKEFWEKKLILEKIDWLVSTIDEVITELPDYKYWKKNIESTIDFMSMTVDMELPDWQLEINQVYIHLQEAKMFLGFELLNIKDHI